MQGTEIEINLGVGCWVLQKPPPTRWKRKPCQLRWQLAPEKPTVESESTNLWVIEPHRYQALRFRPSFPLFSQLSCQRFEAMIDLSVPPGGIWWVVPLGGVPGYIGFPFRACLACVMHWNIKLWRLIWAWSMQIAHRTWRDAHIESVTFGIFI